MTEPHERVKNCTHRKYYLTCEAFDILLALAGDSCQICGKGSRSTLVIDHDHDCYTKVRGLVCTSCNIRLGRIDRKRKMAGPAERAYLDAPFYARLSDEHYFRRPTQSMSSVTVRMDRSQIEWIEQMARKQQRTRSNMAVVLLRKGIAAIEAEEAAGRSARADTKEQQ